MRPFVPQIGAVLNSTWAFSDVPLGKPLLYIDSRGHLAIAVNQGNAQSVLQVKLPSPVLFKKKE